MKVQSCDRSFCCATCEDLNCLLILRLRILLRNDDEERRNVLLSKIEFITENSGFGITDKYDITKAAEQRAEELQQGVRLLPGRSLTIKVSQCSCLVKGWAKEWSLGCVNPAS